MRRLITCVIGPQLLLAFGLVAAAPSADATSTLWSVGTTSSSTTLVCCGSTIMTEKCLNGYTPISGGYAVTSANHDVRRLTEYDNFGDGGTYKVELDASGAWGAVPVDVTATVLCLSSSRFSTSYLATGSFATQANHVATGTVQCNSGYTALTGSVDPTGGGGTTETSMPTNSGTAWTARSWSSDVGSTTYLFVHCVPTSDIPGLAIVTHSDALGWGAGASASCAAGMRPIAGGTYTSYDAGALSIESRPTSTGWVSTTESLGSGSITTTVLCVPANDPSITITSATTPAPNSSTVQWNWSANDPAAGSGFTMTTTCQVVHSGPSGLIVDWDWHSCGNPVTLDNRPDGWIQLNVHSQTSDGRENTAANSILVDTHPPTVSFDDPDGTVFATHAPSVPVHLTDNFYLQNVTCAVDSGPATTCNGSTQGARNLALTGVADGTHTLHVTATDTKTNQTTSDMVFKVDTTAPTVALTKPSSRITVSTSVPLAWTGSDAVAGIASYATQWQESTDSADFGAWSTPQVTSPGTATGRTVTSLHRGSTYCFQVDATDAANNTSGWSASRCTAIPLDDRDLAASSGWTPSSPKGWFAGTALQATHNGASLAATGVTLKRLAVVARKCPTCGVLGVYVGGTRLARLDLHAATAARTVFALPVFSLRTGTVSLRVLSSGKPVQVDALAVSRR